jgi:hypothetical protein
MTVRQAVLLGTIQCLTEFLPVSSRDRLRPFAFWRFPLAALTAPLNLPGAR